MISTSCGLPKVHIPKINIAPRTNIMYHGHAFKGLKCAHVVDYVGFGYADKTINILC
jgi:hypothetical protein